MNHGINIPVKQETGINYLFILPPSQTLKIPVGLAQKSLITGRTSELQTWIAAHFIYPGKCQISDNPAAAISELTQKTPRTIKRHFKRLLKRNWMGKDHKNGWYFFRGIDRIRKIENIQHRRAVIMDKSDVAMCKAFCIASVLASIIKTGRSTETEHVTQRSGPLRGFFPVSLQTIKQAFKCSKPTAINYKKMANSAGYVNTEQNLIQLSIRVIDVKHLKQSGQSVRLPKFGNGDFINVEPHKLRTDRGKVFLQASTLIKGNVSLTMRGSV